MFQPSTSKDPLLTRGGDSDSDGGESVEKHAYDDDSDVWESVYFTDVDEQQTLTPISESIVVEGVDANVLKLPEGDQKFLFVEFSPDWSLVVTLTSSETFSVWNATDEWVLVGSKRLHHDGRILKCIAFDPYIKEAVLLCFDSGEVFRTNLRGPATVDAPGSSQGQEMSYMKRVYKCSNTAESRFDHFKFSSDRKAMVYYSFDGEFAAIRFQRRDKIGTVMLSKGFVLKQDPCIFASGQSILVTFVRRSSRNHESSSEEIGTLFWSGIDFEAREGECKPKRLKGKGYLSRDGKYVLTSMLSHVRSSTDCQIDVYRVEDLKSNINNNHGPSVATILYGYVLNYKGKSYQQYHPFATKTLRFESNHPHLECLDQNQFKSLHANNEDIKPLIAIQQTNSVGSRLVFWDTNYDALIYEIDLTLDKKLRRFSEVKYCWSSNCKWLGVCSIRARMVGLICARSGVLVWTAKVPQLSKEDVGFCTLRFDCSETRLAISLGKVVHLFEPHCLSKKPQNHPMRHSLCLTNTSNTHKDAQIFEMMKAWPKQVLFNILLTSRGVEKVRSFPLDVAISPDSKTLAMICQKNADQCFLFVIDYSKLPSMELLWFLVLQRWNQISLGKKVSVLVKEVEGEQGRKCSSVFYYYDKETREERIALFSRHDGIQILEFDSELTQLSEWIRIFDEGCFSFTQSKERHLVISLTDRHVLTIDLNLKRISTRVQYSFSLSRWWESFLEDVKFFGHSDYYNLVFQECEMEHKLFLQARFRGLFDVSDDGKTILIGWNTEQNRSLIITQDKSEEEFRTEYDEARESLCQCSMMTRDGQWLGFIDYESLRGGDIVVCVVDTKKSRQQRIWLGSDESLIKPSSQQQPSISNFFLQVDDREEKLIALGFKEVGSLNTLTQFSVGLAYDAKCVERPRLLLEGMVQPTNVDKYGERHQPSTFNMRIEGISNFQRVLVEHGEEMAKDVAKNAVDNNIKISDVYLFRENEELDPKTLLSHALDKEDSSLVWLCLCFIEKGMFPFHSAAAMVKDSFFRLLFSYTELFLPILKKNSFALEVGEVKVPAHYFHFPNDLSTYVFTSDTFLEWDKRFVKTRVEDILKSEKSTHRIWNNSHKEGVEVPSSISFYCISNACKVGLKGIIRKLLILDVPEAIFKTELIRATINWKWERLWKRHCLRELCMYIMFLVFFTFYAIGIGLSKDGFVHDKIVSLRLCFPLLGAFILTIIFFSHECMQLKTYVGDGKKVIGTYVWGLKHYFFDSHWNIVELSLYFLVLVLIPIFHGMCTFEVGSKKALFVIVAIESILAWFKLWYYAQPFERTGALVLLINNVIRDCFPFLILAFVVLVGFSVSFYVLFQYISNFSLPNFLDEEAEKLIHESFESPQRSLSTLFYAMVGTFEVKIYYNHQSLSWLTTFLFILYMALEMIVMLNMLIAVMGDTFDKVKNAEDVQVILGRARFIDAYEASLTARKIEKIEKQIGKFLYVLTPKDNEYALKKLNWKGKLWAIDENISKAVKAIKETVKEEINMEQHLRQMKKLLEELQKKDQDFLHSIMERIEALEARTSRIESGADHSST